MSEQPDEDAFEETVDDAGVPADVQAEVSADEPLDQPDEPLDGSDGGADDGSSSGPAAAATGHPAVDEVLRSLEGLDGRPVDEHVAAFEQAHDALRRALSSAGDDTP